jgi:hypothetical protein
MKTGPLCLPDWEIQLIPKHYNFSRHHWKEESGQKLKLHVLKAAKKTKAKKSLMFQMKHMSSLVTP